MRTHRSPRNQQRLWRALGGAALPLPRRTIAERLDSARAILERLRPGSPAYAVQAREVQRLLVERAKGGG